MASLIKSISLKNFKGFSDEVRIDLKPITLLFGANSAGKSSILQALQYVREILERNNTNPDRTLQGGEAVDLGGFLNLVHGRDPEQRIEIEIGMDVRGESIPELVPESFDEWSGSNEVYEFYNHLYTIRRSVLDVSIRLEIAWHATRETAVVTAYQVSINGAWCVRLVSSAYGRDVSMQINRDNPVFLRQQTQAEADDEADMDAMFADVVDEADIPAGPIPEGIGPAERKWVSDLPGILAVVRDAGLERPSSGLRSWLYGFGSALPKLDKMLEIPVSGIQGAENIYIAREFTAFLSWLTVGPAMLLRDQLQAARYLGPLRRVPPRGFDVSLTKSEAAWSDGMAAWECLMTSSQAMLDRCSDWMQNVSRLNTGYGLQRTQVQERDVATGAPLGRIKPRIALTDRSGLALQPQDVGVGISQVLPVVVAAQDEHASLISVEQPELHVHPAVQVGLGDLFIDGAVERDLSFLLETHSEHLILRLLRRIREAAEAGNTDQINPDLLGVYYLANENGRITATQLPANKEGDFDTPWPKGFFEERGEELFS
ncbi:AAA family ATPase [Niveibacterium sp. SC-1]|uniref:AAA family ATPase n=1 Tax=Niveibacterium sp. SC-1 TaxID=3135646 RepID=UPI00312025DD